MSSMVWDAYEMGITSELGGVPYDRFLCDTYEDNYEEEYENDNLGVEFNIGDIVKLNSSDVLMTIKSIDNDILECRWFDKNDNIQNDKFNIAEIILVNKEKNYQNYSDSEIEEIEEIYIDEEILF